MSTNTPTPPEQSTIRLATIAGTIVLVVMVLVGGFAPNCSEHNAQYLFGKSAPLQGPTHEAEH